MAYKRHTSSNDYAETMSLFMNINFIVTCYDKEEYFLGLLEVFKTYKKINPKIVFAYNGAWESFPADVRLPNRGHQLGDIDLTIAGYRKLVGNGVTKFVKLCIDSWLLNEDVVIEIFKQMSSGRCCYAGNYWFENSRTSLSTDIFFVDIEFGNVFEGFDWDGSYYETSMYSTLVSMNSNILFIGPREPVVPHNRFAVKALDWTMSHDVRENLKNFWDFQKRQAWGDCRTMGDR